jgi:hypothetical protein
MYLEWEDQQRELRLTHVKDPKRKCLQQQGGDQW